MLAGEVPGLCAYGSLLKVHKPVRKRIWEAPNPSLLFGQISFKKKRCVFENFMSKDSHRVLGMFGSWWLGSRRQACCGLYVGVSGKLCDCPRRLQ
jgi:hypothetical protein